MSFTRQAFKALLDHDESRAYTWEKIPEREKRARRLAAPATNLGAGRGRFWQLLRHLHAHIVRGESICDFGAYPGTTLRLIRQIGHGTNAQLAAAGFNHNESYIAAMQALGVALIELEFDLRYTPASSNNHILTYPVGEPGYAHQFDVAICTEVIEHQLYPLALLTGMNRFVKNGGVLYLTTNSVSFIGDILKLLVGRHNIEPLQKSHVLNDHLWRPHIRLYTLAELQQLLELCGFRVRFGYYFDNGNVYQGLKGLLAVGLRGACNLVPHLRSHIFVSATKMSNPHKQALEYLGSMIKIYHLESSLGRPGTARKKHVQEVIP